MEQKQNAYTVLVVQISKMMAPNCHSDLFRNHTVTDQADDNLLASCHCIVAFIKSVLLICGQIGVILLYKCLDNHLD